MNPADDRPVIPPTEPAQASSAPPELAASESRDPITHAPDYHPVGTGLGAAGGGFAAAVTGAMIGGAVSGPAAPIGAVVGAVVGAFAGGYAGKEIAGHHEPAHDDAYWRDRHRTAAFSNPGDDYEQDFRPAYQYGAQARTQYPGRDFDEVEPDLSRGWDRAKASSQLAWDRARDAAREAWRHADRPINIDHCRPQLDSEPLSEPSPQGTLDPNRGYNPGFGQTVTDSTNPGPA